MELDSRVIEGNLTSKTWLTLLGVPRARAGHFYHMSCFHIGSDSDQSLKLTKKMKMSESEWSCDVRVWKLDCGCV